MIVFVELHGRAKSLLFQKEWLCFCDVSCIFLATNNSRGLYTYPLLCIRKNENKLQSHDNNEFLLFYNNNIL